MSDKTASGVHWSFWVIAAVALVWNLMGAMNFIMQMNPEMVASMPETHRAIIDSRPIWATAGFAVGVFGGAIGGLLLLLRKSLAVYVFIASLIGVVVTMVHSLGLEIQFSAFERVMMVFMPLGVGTFLIWYAKLAVTKGWIS